MSRDQFIANYVTTFVATWTVINYGDYCMRGLQKELENPPVEDALHLADKQWKLIMKHTGGL